MNTHMLEFELRAFFQHQVSAPPLRYIANHMHYY